MVSITATDVSLVFPFVGSDRRFGKRLQARGSGELGIGGHIVAGSRGGVRAIDGLNLRLNDGDRLGIFGHNGAGKTTLLRVLAGIYPPTQGEIRIEGKVSGLFSLGLGINKEVSGLDNITLKGMMYGLRRAEIKSRIEEIVAFSELGDYIYMPVKTYSSGMALRLQFSIASALRPDILLMDEWVSSADKDFRAKMDSRLEAMIEETPIVIIASHSESRLEAWANRVIVMENGRIREDRDTTEVVGRALNFKPDADLVGEFKRLINLRQFEAAMGLIDDVWPSDRDPISNLNQKAILALRTGDIERASALYAKLVTFDQVDPKIMDQYGRLLIRLGDDAAGADWIARALRESGGLVGNVAAFRKAFDKLGQGDQTESRLQDIFEAAKSD